MDRVRMQLGIDDIKRSNKHITVAVLDSGIEIEHPDLADSVSLFHDFVYRKNKIYDDYGHGTHVCGCIAGSGKASNGKYRGIAPGTKFVIGKVLDQNGDGTIENMIRGIYWVINHRQQYQIRILNISVGTGNGYDEKEFDEIMKAINLAWYQGIMVICAAGNGGPRKNSISAIGRNKNILTVGCHDGGEQDKKSRPCEMYSGRGMETYYFRKPDIVAPGTGIVSCNGISGKKEGYYSLKSGTSMATAIVSGVAALYFEKHYEESNEFCKREMIITAKDLGEPWNKQGYGMVNPRVFL